MNPVGLVIRREIVERLKARSFLVSTIIYLLVAMAFVVVPHVVGHHDTVYGVGLTGDGAPAYGQSLGQLAPTLGVKVRTQSYPDAAAAQEAVTAGKVSVALVDGTRLISRKDPPDQLRVLLNTAVYQVNLAQRLSRAGVKPGDVAALVAPAPLAVDKVAKQQPIREKNKPLAFAGVLIIYLLMLTYGFTVANGVLEEKSSRVSEILLGALRPAQLLAGKVTGIGVVAVVQLLLIGVPAAVVALVLGSFHIPSGTPLTLAAVFLWAVVGYGLYSCIFAAAGAAASRPEDVGNATAPLTILIAATYFAATATVQSPDGSFARVVSFIPLMSPMTMLPRAAVGHVHPWEVPLAVVLALATTWVSVRLGARVYAGGIRRPGPKLKIKEAWRAAGG